MKKIIYTILAGLVLLTSCSKEKIEEQPRPETISGENIRICASIGDKKADTRVSFDYDNNFAWEIAPNKPYQSPDNLILAGFDELNAFRGWSRFELKALDGQTAYFEGKTVNGATHYKITYFYQETGNKLWTGSCSAYDQKHFELTGEMIMNYDYTSYAFKHSLEYPVNYKIQICMGTEISAEDLNKPIKLRLYNTAICFDFHSLPETLGNHVQQFTWINNDGTPDECALTFAFSDGFDIKGKQLYTFIEPQKMNLKAGNKIVLKLDGSTLQTVQATSMNGKDYEGGKKYIISISDKEIPGQQTLHDWKLEQQDNEIWFEGREAIRPNDKGYTYYEMHQIPNTKTYILRHSEKIGNEYIPFTDLNCTPFLENMNLNPNFFKVIFPRTIEVMANDQFKENKDITHYVFHKDCPLVEIPSSAFQFSAAEDVILPDNLKIIKTLAFSSSALKKINITAGVENIEGSAFEFCSQLTELTFAKDSKIRTIEQQAFRCSSLGSISLPEGLVTIQNRAFQKTPAVNITIPSTVQELGSEAFDQTEIKDGTLKNVYCYATSQILTKAGDHCFSANQCSKATLHLPKSEKISNHPLKLSYSWYRIKYDL